MYTIEDETKHITLQLKTTISKINYITMLMEETPAQNNFRSMYDSHLTS